VLGEGGFDPTVVVGGRLRAIGSGARLGTGTFLVAEADESDGSFLRLTPTIAVITNIDREHLDHWRGGIGEIQTAFVEFANKVPFYGLNVVCVEDPRTAEILPRLNRRVATYGLGPDVQYRVADVRAHDDWSLTFEVYERGFLLGRARLPVPGRHNALNAMAAVAVGRELEMKPASILRALESFAGVARRFELKGEEGGVLVVDDYGHHPNEIRAVLRAAREHSPRRRVVIFQPHRYTRTRDLLPEFGGAFADADVLFLAPIYPAGEAPIPGITTERLLEEIRASGHPDCRLAPDLAEIPEAVRSVTRHGDLVLTLGAGSVHKVGEALLKDLSARGVGAGT
jgi:UDP-N-acetylmuramate--alanine ligase